MRHRSGSPVSDELMDGNPHMLRRLLLPTVATLSLLSACGGSPEAGRPDTVPTSSSATPTAAPAHPSSQGWSAEQQAAVTAATARYVIALAAVDKALREPRVSSRGALEAAGLSDKRILDAIGDVRTLRDSGWYRVGGAQIRSVAVTAIELGGAQPDVRLRACVDLSTAVLHFQKDHKVVPVAASSSKRVIFSAELRYTARPSSLAKMWFLIDEKAVGTC